MKLNPTRRTVRATLAGTVALVALVGGGLTGCSAGGGATTTDGETAPAGDPVYGGVLDVALSSIPAIIDPFATSLQADWVVARQVCEPLFDVSTSYEVKPVLVESYDYDGDVTYVLTLRDGVKFQSGADFTPDDVIASLERYFNTPGNGSILAGMTKSIEATGDNEVTITLNSPSAIVPTLLTTAYMMPASVVKDREITDPVTELDCTGPYTLTNYSPNGPITLDRWDDYQPVDGESDGATGEKKAYADQIVFTGVPEESTRIQQVETGQIDIGGAVALDNYEPILQNGQAQALTLKPVSGSVVVFNKAEGIMSDVKMRQAFLAALNMDDILLAGFGNPDFYTTDGSLIPAVNEAWSTDAGTEPYNNQDLDKVAQLLEEAGYNGEPIVWMTTEEDPTWYGPALPAQQQLKEAGINIDLQVVDRATLIDRRNHPDQFDLFSSGIPTYADPVLLPYLQESFPGTWTSSERDDLLAQLSSEPDQEARKAIWEELQTLVWQDVPFLKFGTLANVVVAATDVHAERVDELSSSNYFNIWLDQ